jgi:hypothetical protein
MSWKNLDGVSAQHFAGFRRSFGDITRVLEWRAGRRWRVVRHRSDVLNYLAATNGYRRYLEIGVRDPRANFNRVRVRRKVSVDPSPRGRVTFKLTSDAFFAQLSHMSGMETFDLIFIDGLHEAHQVERDIENSLSHLAPGGTIVVHDCNPPSERAQLTDYDGTEVWTGTVWRAWVRLRASRSDLEMYVVDVDYGCGVLTRGNQECYALGSVSGEDIAYHMLDADRRRMLNLLSPRDFMERVARGHGASSANRATSAAR